MEIEMRDVIQSDSGLILAWRNSELSIKYSKSGSSISANEHEIWFLNRICQNRSEPYLMISQSNSQIGAIRFDNLEASSPYFIVSIIVNPALTRQGYGTKILQLGCKYMYEEFGTVRICAEIHKDNVASLKLFMKNNFQVIGNNSDFIMLEYSHEQEVFNNQGVISE
jgi:RimJ/RimL family protein N-acetyltransferase